MSKAEKFIQDCTRGCSNELCAVEDRFGKKVISYHEWLTPDQALKAVEIAKEELLEKAILWMKTHTFMFESLEDVELYKELFKQAMQDE